MILQFLVLIFLLPVSASVVSSRASYFLMATASLLALLFSVFGVVQGITESAVYANNLVLGSDPLSDFFVMVSSVVWFLASVYSLQYDSNPKTNCAMYSVAIYCMLIVLLSRSTILFMFGWEGMSIAGFFMIGYKKHVKSFPAFVFLMFSELSSLLLILTFGFFFYLSGSFLIPQTASLTPFIFIGMTGFFIKMGLLPFAVTEWLPIAHGSAPANGSILLSSVMTLMGVYGILRFTMIAGSSVDYGIALMSIGAFSALFAALYAASSEHTKSLPAFSTIENNGAILVSVGAYMVTESLGYASLAGFALATTLLYSFAHSVAKSGVFMFSGVIEKTTGRVKLTDVEGSQSGFKHATGGLFSALSLMGLLPFGGGLGEWMLLETLFVMSTLPNLFVSVVSIIVGAAIALGSGASLVAMSKLYGFGVLWKKGLSKGGLMSSALFSTGCTVALLGLLGVLVIFIYNSVVMDFADYSTHLILSGLLAIPNGLLIVSSSPQGTFGFVSPTMDFALISLFTAITYVAVGKMRMRRTKVWNNGVPLRGRYNSFAYSNPLRLMLKVFYRTHEHSSTNQASHETIMDIFWVVMIRLAKLVSRFSEQFGRGFMNSKISYYLLYMTVAFAAVMVYLVA